VFARTAPELATAVKEPTDLVIVDLTTAGYDYDALFAELEERPPGAPVLGITTHVLARQTQPLHRHCARVVTREALTRELGTILTGGIAA
jgi:hypothetical protein